MSGIFQLLGGLAPQGPTNAAREYDGFELRWKMFVFRPATFKFEGIMLAILGLYVAIHLVGKAINMGRARKTVDAFTPLVTDNFTSVRPLLSSSSALHLLYATGRRNVLCLQATLKLQPLHDIISLIWQTVWSIIEPTSDNSEALEVDLTLGRGASGLQGEAAGVWAIIDKGSLTKTRTRFDLSFPRLHESAVVPITHSLFSEHSEITDALLKTPNVGITDLLANPAAAKVLKTFIVTDQPPMRPTKGPLKAEHKARKVEVTFNKPASTSDNEAVTAWLQVALNVSDLISRPGFVKAEVGRKLARTRAEVDVSLEKQYQKELQEDGLAEKSPEDKRAERKRLERSQLSEKELKRQEELNRKREMRKMQKKQMKA